MPVKILVIPYLITIVTETIAALFCGIRKPLELFKIFLINTITNPVINLLYFRLQIYLPYEYSAIELFILETVVVVSEGWLFRFFLEWENENSGFRPWRLSLILNIASFLAGDILNIFF